ncbi:protein prenyltransferase alpha subunit repeat-containing protein 1 [Diorhabda sublineata]|uniref:protein prenyltransferase alpha subunit repeat-containing protein 1 n=1 Tax=Diorhabda sublineata TaxID=1163346 RepID=UPI0024E13C3D|nr:protein prenyltransferase alpha subunit repeat-containing protein 1 [Diorhabda sublineata]
MKSNLYIFEMTDDNAMSSRILNTIEAIVKNDRVLDFEIIPVEDNSTNKSPVVYEHYHLGLESWCTKHVYRYACSELFKKRPLLAKKRLSYSEMERLDNFLIGVLLINPDVTTFWNMKRELVECGILKEQDELKFSKIVLTYKAKSNEVFSYRKWLIKRLLEKTPTADWDNPITLMLDEFAVIHMASSKAPNNYHSWNHRIWCMENIASHHPTISRIVKSELEYSHQWIYSHMSEYAGYNYRQYLILLVKRHKGIVETFNSFYVAVRGKDYDSIVDFATYLLGKTDNSEVLENITSYVNYICILLYDNTRTIPKLNCWPPVRESLFNHKKFVVYHLVKVIYEYHGLNIRSRFYTRGSELAKGTDNVTRSNTILTSAHVKIDKKSCPTSYLPRPVVWSRINETRLFNCIIDQESDFFIKNFDNSNLIRYRNWFICILGFKLDFYEFAPME